MDNWDGVFKGVFKKVCQIGLKNVVVVFWKTLSLLLLTTEIDQSFYVCIAKSVNRTTLCLRASFYINTNRKPKPVTEKTRKDIYVLFWQSNTFIIFTAFIIYAKIAEP